MTYLAFIKVQEPIFLSEKFAFKCTPLNLFVFIYNLVILFEFVAPNDNCLALMQDTALAELSVSTKTLYLMALLTSVLSILNVLIMLLIALLSAKRTVLITANRPRS
jgi:hypothetical protein